MKLCGVPCGLTYKILKMEPQEVEKPTIDTRAFTQESGGTPLSLEALPMGLPGQFDIMDQHHSNSSARQWQFSELLAQKKLIGSYSVSTDDTDGTVIYSFRHTFENVLNMHFKTLSSLFRLYSWTLHFRFEVRSNFQQVGQIIIGNHHIPRNVANLLTGNTETSPPYSNYYFATMLPHQKVPLGEDTDIDVKMMWDAPVSAASGTLKSYRYRVDDSTDYEYYGYDMGTVYATVGQKMQVASGVNPSATVRVWSWLTDVKMAAYDPDDSTI
nr:putative capsid [Linepithema humile polycipivirus 2]